MTTEQASNVGAWLKPGMELTSPDGRTKGTLRADPEGGWAIDGGAQQWRRQTTAWVLDNW